MVGDPERIESLIWQLGSYDFTISAREIAEISLGDIGVFDPGEPIGVQDLAIAMRKLNLIVKQWMGMGDFAPGLKMWSRKRGYIFLAQGEPEYSIGPSGDHSARSYVDTTLSAGAALGAGTLTVSSIVGMATTNNIGIELADGSLFWTTINGAPSGSTVTLMDTLTGAANSGARVFVYTTKMIRPLQILTALLRDDQGNDSPIAAMDLPAFESIADKNALGDLSRFYYESQLTNGTLFLDAGPNDVTKVIRLTYLAPIEDIDTENDDVDLPQHWFRPLCAQLSIDLAPTFSRPVSQALKLVRDESLAMAKVLILMKRRYFSAGYRLMIEFMVIAHPRSGTTWAANWLTTDTTLCLHDPLAYRHYAEWDDFESSKMLGVSDCGVCAFPDFLNSHPARKVILHRDRKEIAESLGMPEFLLSPDHLDEIQGMHVHFPICGRIQNRSMSICCNAISTPFAMKN